jgi:hypothetical protein
MFFSNPQAPPADSDGYIGKSAKFIQQKMTASITPFNRELCTLKTSYIIGPVNTLLFEGPKKQTG